MISSGLSTGSQDRYVHANAIVHQINNISHKKSGLLRSHFQMLSYFKTILFDYLPQVFYHDLQHPMQFEK